MKKKNFNILVALVNIASFWLGFKVFTLGSDLLIVIFIIVWLVLVKSMSFIKVT